MTEERTEDWEFYRRLVVAQLASLQRETDALKTEVTVLRETKIYLAAQVKMIAVVWPVVLTAIGWVVKYMMEKQ